MEPKFRLVEVCRREGLWDAAAAEERVLGKKWQLVSSLRALARALPPYPFWLPALHLVFAPRELPGVTVDKEANILAVTLV